MLDAEEHYLSHLLGLIPIPYLVQIQINLGTQCDAKFHHGVSLESNLCIIDKLSLFCVGSAGKASALCFLSCRHKCAVCCSELCKLTSAESQLSDRAGRLPDCFPNPSHSIDVTSVLSLPQFFCAQSQDCNMLQKKSGNIKKEQKAFFSPCQYYVNSYSSS